MGNIRREDVLNCPLTFTAKNDHDAKIIQEVLHAVMEYVKKLPPAEEAKLPPAEEAVQKRPATRRKKS